MLPKTCDNRRTGGREGAREGGSKREARQAVTGTLDLETPACLGCDRRLPRLAATSALITMTHERPDPAPEPRSKWACPGQGGAGGGAGKAHGGWGAMADAGPTTVAHFAAVEVGRGWGVGLILGGRVGGWGLRKISSTPVGPQKSFAEFAGFKSHRVSAPLAVSETVCIAGSDEAADGFVVWRISSVSSNFS
jgi:hypothetical protein